MVARINTFHREGSQRKTSPPQRPASHFSVLSRNGTRVAVLRPINHLAYLGTWAAAPSVIISTGYVRSGVETPLLLTPITQLNQLAD